MWIQILVMGVIGIAGIALQLKKLAAAGQFVPLATVGLGGVLLVGSFIHGIFYVFLGSGGYSFFDFLQVLWTIIFTTIVLTLKSVFGPLIVTILILATIFTFFDSHMINFWSFEDFMYFIDWVVSGFPKWLQSVYTVITFLAVFAGAIESIF